jgi:hypothetical protein
VNLHPQHARLVTALPGRRPSVTLERGGAGPEGLGMRADTLWIDTDRGICTVTWRGHAWLRSATEAGRVIATVMDTADVPAQGSMKQSSAGPTDTLLPLVAVNAPLPFASAAPGASPLARPGAPSPSEAASAEEISIDSADDQGSSGTPETIFLPPQGARPSLQTLPFDRLLSDATLMVLPEAAALISGPPFSPPAVAPAMAPSAAMAPPAAPLPMTPPVVGPAPLSPPPMRPAMSPPAMAPPPVPPPLVEPRRDPHGPIGAAIAESPWGGVSREAPKAMTVGEAAAAASSAEKERGRTPLADPPGPKPAAPPPAAAVPSLNDAARAGAAGASNAAAQSSQPVETKPAFSFRPALELVWHNPGSLARIRKNEAWKPLLADLKPRPEEDDLDDDMPPPRRVPPKDRRELLAILSRGEPTDADGVELALRRALEDEAAFLPPLVLAAGDLELQFDELEALKATIAAVSPHLGASEALRKTVEGIQEIFKTPFVQGANSVLVDLSRRLREAFAPVQKGLPSYDLEAHVQATLVDHRHYQKRSAFGQPRLRALFTTPGARAVVPAYLPDSLAKELPGFRRMRVRLIAEVRPRVDEGDVGTAALRVVAMGREATM